MVLLLNLIKIIYSHIIFNKYKNVSLNTNIINKIIKSRFTANLLNYEICTWIKYLKKNNQYNNWNPYQMYREWLYHKNCYKYGLFIAHTNYVDYEKRQTIKTYIYRIIGNCIY